MPSQETYRVDNLTVHTIATAKESVNLDQRLNERQDFTPTSKCDLMSVQTVPEIKMVGAIVQSLNKSKSESSNFDSDNHQDSKIQVASQDFQVLTNGKPSLVKLPDINTSQIKVIENTEEEQNTHNTSEKQLTAQEQLLSNSELNPCILSEMLSAPEITDQATLNEDKAVTEPKNEVETPCILVES